MTAGTVVVFECLHTQLFTYHPPKTGEMVLCPRCGDYKRVATAPHGYAVRCESCPYHRDYGNAQITAETSAVKHATRKAGHRVILTDNGIEIRTFHHPVIQVSVPPF